MKLNWGFGIVLAFIGFIAFILYFVFLASTDEQADYDLVTDEYYRKELEYQKEIDAEENAREVASDFVFVKTAEGLRVDVPESLQQQNINGTMSLYRPSNKHLDFDLPVSLSNTHLLIPDNRLLDGRWDISIRWEYDGKTYLVKERLTY